MSGDGTCLPSNSDRRDRHDEFFVVGAVTLQPDACGTERAAGWDDSAFVRNDRRAPTASIWRPMPRTAVPTACQKDCGPGGRAAHARFWRAYAGMLMRAA